MYSWVWVKVINCTHAIVPWYSYSLCIAEIILTSRSAIGTKVVIKLETPTKVIQYSTVMILSIKKHINVTTREIQWENEYKQKKTNRECKYQQNSSTFNFFKIQWVNLNKIITKMS